MSVLACPCGTLIDTDNSECWGDDDIARCEPCREALDEEKDRTVKGGADCEECGGTGKRERREDSAPMECYACDGTGREPEVQP